MGAGVIPFCVFKNKVYFLFQKTFTGRKTGYLIDFGGGVGMGESYLQTAMREFIEETETLFFSNDISTAARTEEKVAEQLPIIEKLFNETLQQHPNWYCLRDKGTKEKPKDWRTFFIEVEYKDLSPFNQAWKNDTTGRFKKRRELHWVLAEDLFEIYQQSPERLWKRVRQLVNAEQIIQEILLEKTNSSNHAKNQ